MVWQVEILESEDLELILLPSIGGRLIDVKYKGVSLLFQNPDLLSHQPDLKKLKDLPSRATHLPFPLWGGEKTWIAPDYNWPDGAPHAALDSGSYTFQYHGSDGISMTSPICPISKLQIIRRIEIRPEGGWRILHQVINKGTENQQLGIWSVMMTKAPSSYLFRPAHEQLPTTVFGTPESAFRITNGISKIDCYAGKEFKLGAHPLNGISAARIPTSIGTVWIINTASELTQADQYAHGHALEFYNSAHYNYGELEWHSPSVLLQPEQAFEFELGYQIVPESDNLSWSENFKKIENHIGNSQ